MGFECLVCDLVHYNFKVSVLIVVLTRLELVILFRDHILISLSLIIKKKDNRCKIIKRKKKKLLK